MTWYPSAEPESPEGVAPTTTAPASLWEDFVDIFYAPSEVFARRVVGKIAKQSAAIAAAITWLAGGLPAILGALRSG